MEITEIRIHLRNEEKLKAYAAVTFDKCFVVRDMKVINGNTGMFVAMPSRKKPDGTYKDIAHPLDVETRQKLESTILSAYQEELNRTKDQLPAAPQAVDIRITEKMNFGAKVAESKLNL